MKPKSRLHMVLVIVLVSALVAGCTGKQGGDVKPPVAEGPVYGGKLVVAIPTDPDGMDPHKAASAAAEEILFNVYEGLVTSDTEGNIVAAIAKEWTVEDNRVYTFKIREGVKFHNGRTVTADDVVFSLERIMNPETGHPRLSEYKVVEKVEKLDELTVRITLKEPNAPFLSNLAAVSGAIVPKEAVDTLKDKPVGTGPFKYVDWTTGQHIKLEKNPDYWKDNLPYLDEVEFRIMADPAAQLMALKTGDVDVVPRVANESASEVEADPNLKLLKAPQNLIQLMTMNLKREPFNNLKVRQAINYAVNKAEIIEGAMWGYGTELGSNMSPVMAYWYKDLTGTYPYNPEKAKQLLAEAGYPNGFETTLALPAPYAPHVRTGEIIADQLAKVGIKVKLQVIEWGVWLDDVYTKRNYDMTVIGLTGKLDPHIVLMRYESTYSRNFFNYENPEYDRYLQEARVIADPAKRQEIYYKLQEFLARDAVAVYIQDPSLLIAMKKEVEGWQVYPVYVADISRVYKSK
ncbi:MAG: ABC transporter substrate-binding protein [Bacillota bacterium]